MARQLERVAAPAAQRLRYASRASMATVGIAREPTSAIIHGALRGTDRARRRVRMDASGRRRRPTRRVTSGHRTPAQSRIFEIPIDLGRPAELLRRITGWVGDGNGARRGSCTSTRTCSTSRGAARAARRAGGRRPRLLRRLRRPPGRQGARRRDPAPHDRRRLGLGPGGAVRDLRAVGLPAGLRARRRGGGGRAPAPLVPAPARSPAATTATSSSAPPTTSASSRTSTRAARTSSWSAWARPSRSCGWSATPPARHRRRVDRRRAVRLRLADAYRARRPGWPTMAWNGSSAWRSSRTGCGAATCWATRCSSAG